MRKIIPVIGLILILTVVGAQVGLAESNVTIFFVACESTAVVNFSGNMDAGYDVYYQVFSGAGATGTALTSLRQAQVDGAYAYSEVISYNSGSTVPAAGFGSVKVYVGRESNPNSVSGETFVVDDIQDGCNNPQNALGTSVDAGSGASSSTTTSGGSILSPFGGVINPAVANATPEPAVVIGARVNPTIGRSGTPGVLFAECDDYLPQAAPGLLYDNDNIIIFWSWFARTPQQVEDHIFQANYGVTLNRAPLKEVQVSGITRPTNLSYWVFYTANIGKLTPGTYGVEFRLNWKQAITDGYDDYGPGTDNVEVYSTCTFTIERNPNGINVTDFNRMYSLQ